MEPRQEQVQQVASQALVAGTVQLLVLKSMRAPIQFGPDGFPTDTKTEFFLSPHAKCVLQRKVLSVDESGVTPIKLNMLIKHADPAKETQVLAFSYVRRTFGDAAKDLETEKAFERYTDVTLSFWGTLSRLKKFAEPDPEQVDLHTFSVALVHLSVLKLLRAPAQFGPDGDPVDVKMELSSLTPWASCVLQRKGLPAGSAHARAGGPAKVNMYVKHTDPALENELLAFSYVRRTFGDPAKDADLEKAFADFVTVAFEFWGKPPTRKASTAAGVFTVPPPFALLKAVAGKVPSKKRGRDFGKAAEARSRKK